MSSDESDPISPGRLVSALHADAPVSRAASPAPFLVRSIRPLHLDGVVRDEVV